MIDSISWNSARDEAVHRTVGEAQLKKYGNFFNKSIEDSSWVPDTSLKYVIQGPIRLFYNPREDITIMDMVEMENKTLAKLLAAVAGTCREIRLLKIEGNKFYQRLLTQGDRCSVDAKGDNVNILLSILQDLSAYVNRVSLVANLTIQQLSNLTSNAYDIYFPLVIEHLVDLFVIFVTLDEVIAAQPSLLDTWDQYCIRASTMLHNSEQFNIPSSKLCTFEKLLKDLRHQLLANNLFLVAIDRAMDVKKSPIMQNRFACYLKNTMLDVEKKASDNLVFNKNWIRTNVAAVVIVKLFGTVDKKVLKRLCEMNKKYYSINLIGNIIWIPNKFLANAIPKEAGMLVGSQAGEKILASKIQKLSEVTNSLARRATQWSVEMQYIFVQPVEKFQQSDLERRCCILIEFVNLVQQVKENIFFTTNLHAALLKPMSRNIVQLVCRLIEMQKSLETTFYTFGSVIILSQSHVIQHLSYQILVILETAKRGLMLSKDKGYSREQLDAMTLIGLGMRLMNGPPTDDRRLITRCALAAASQLTDSFKEEELVKLRGHLDAYDTIAELHDLVRQACDYSIVLYHRSMLPAYLSMVIDGNSDISRIVHLLSALNSAVTDHEPPNSMDSRNKEHREMLVKYVLEPACHEIETSLRLHVHAHLKLDDSNPFKIGAVNSNRIVRASPLPVADNFLSPKRFIEHYLDSMFYNLTTVALHDWRTYGTMRRLAGYKLNLEMVQDHLPTQNLEQGLDALEIMRNINTFVAKYLYNLNTQTFIERTSSNKYLNTIGIRHIANSIRTHGNGIMSTTVNFVYQFLRAKLHTFSQFLFDEHIKSRLIRDIRFIKLQRESRATPYTYERAEKFQKGIRKLGMTTDGLSYLDQFRILVSQIGNALGYVRLIRSGGLHACSNAIAFLPAINSDTVFESTCKMLDFTITTQAAGKRLDDDIANLVQSFTEGTQYFRLLVDVFASAFRDTKNIHLQQFYAIIPPLTLSYVDNALANKEKMSKKNKTGAAFTDDGFAMGVAYINALLDQNTEIDGLQWFKTVEEQMTLERIAAQHKDDCGDEKLQQTRALTLKRLVERNAEFQLLYYSLSGARVFFKQPDMSSL
ncbi:WASH complex subunit 4 [Diprion similis]|uniref:WASH complex subunit 4 n=1 Tax=Diprion similis TaxID=362088 RepID=UPI001EF978E2|nr:WASH complex subunit 4 [Diprion similis]